MVNDAAAELEKTRIRDRRNCRRRELRHEKSTAQTTAERILADANNTAQRIVADANSAAAEILQKAAHEATVLFSTSTSKSAKAEPSTVLALPGTAEASRMVALIESSLQAVEEFMVLVGEKSERGERSDSELRCNFRKDRGKSFQPVDVGLLRKKRRAELNKVSSVMKKQSLAADSKMPALELALVGGTSMSD